MARTPSRRSYAAKLLDRLPSVDARRKALYLAAFTPAQCVAWGRRTRATKVLAEAERFIASLARALERPVPTYSAHRFAWLCSLVAELAVSCAAIDDGSVVRLARARAMESALSAKRRLHAALSAASEGNPVVRSQLRAHTRKTPTATTLHASLVALLAVAETLRSTDDGALLAADVGLSAAMLSSVKQQADALREATVATFGAPLPVDDVALNHLEGRVLREMSFAMKTISRARAVGEAGEVPRAGQYLTTLMGRGRLRRASTDAPTAPEREG